jgi:hypothetical protein
MRKIIILIALAALALPSHAAGVHVPVAASHQESFQLVTEVSTVDLFDLSDTPNPGYPEMYAAGEACDQVGLSVCGASCYNKLSGSAVLVAITCSTTDDPGRFHCGCTVLMPGPYNPQRYWGGGLLY